MAAGNTYSQIASTTLGSAAASVTFSSIAGTYTDLVLVITPIYVTSGTEVDITFNGDTASNYSRTQLGGNGTAAVSVRETSATKFRLTYSANVATTYAYNAIVNFMNYSNTTTYKTALSRGNNASGGVEAEVGLWRSTDAIITIGVASSGTFNTGSTFNLYGILAA